MTTTNEYDSNARTIADRIGLTVAAVLKDQACPRWETDEKHIHGDRYRVTLTNQNGDTLHFDYWNSYHDKQTGQTPTTYDILACVSSDASLPTDPDEIAAELGPMKPSQAIAAAKFAARLQTFFTDDELTALQEIS